jgi:hypothetical protein
MTVATETKLVRIVFSRLSQEVPVEATLQDTAASMLGTSFEGKSTVIKRVKNDL